MRRSIPIALSVVGLLGLVFVLYAFFLGPAAEHTASASKPEIPKLIPVYTTTVQRRMMSQETTATGDILAAARVEVFSKVEGRLEMLQVEQGDRVQTGQVIARITAAELQARAERTSAELDAFRAIWAQTEAGALPQEIAQAEDQVRHTSADLANAERVLERTRALVQRGLRAPQDLEEAAVRLTHARAAHNSAEQRLHLLRAGARVEDRQAQQARLRAAQAALRLAHTELQNAVITAAISGVVSHRHVDLGAYITERTPLITIVDMDTVRIKVPISERDIGKMQPGLQARIQVDAYPQDIFAGTVRRISPTIDPASRNGEVEIVAANPQHRLKPGMFAKVTLRLEERPDVLVIPRQALARQDGNPAVFVVRDGRAHLQQVTTGLHNDTQVEIIAPLAPDTLIIVAGHHKLEDNALVKIVPRPEGQ
jgi:multidrug efflux pump subunit AcrA (membrane-fusion protein)